MFRALALFFSVISYCLFGISLAWLLAFLTNIGLPLTIDRGDLAPPVHPLGWNLALLLVFGVQHSVMARPAFKRWWTKRVPAVIERSLYVFISSLLVIALCVFWKPMPALVWATETPVAQIAWWLIFLVGFAWLIGSSFLIDHFELLGLKQGWFAFRKRVARPPAFAVRGFYRLVRHPIYVGWLLLFWATPTMSQGRFLFALGMTAYTLIAIRFEERDLVALHGDDYRDYQKKSGALLPRWRDLFSRCGTLTLIALAALSLILAMQYRRHPWLEAAITRAQTATMEQVSIQTGDRARHARIHVPSGVQPRRLVVLLHGAGGNVDRLRLLTARRFESLAEEAGWVVAYPVGVGGTWNDCRRVPDYPAKRAGVDDVSFLGELIERLAQRFELPIGETLVAGFSNGGHMALRLALESEAPFSAIALVGAQYPAQDDSSCDLAAPPRRHVLLVNGMLDPVSPFAGGESMDLSGAPLGSVMSVVDTVKALGIVVPRDLNDNAPVLRLSKARPDGFLVRTVILKEAGHVIPGPGRWFPAAAGPTESRTDFADEVRAFFDMLDSASDE